MKKALIAAAAVALSFAAAPAFAQDASGPQGYASLGAMVLADDFVSLGGVQARLGAKFTPNFAIEVEGAVGVVEDSISGVDIQLDHQLAGYLVGFFPVSDQTEFIGRVGYSTFQVSVPGGSGSADTVNFGVGVQHNFDDHNSLRGDYTFMSGDGDANMYSLAYVRRF